MYDGTPYPWEFMRVWHLEPSLADPNTVDAGMEDSALFRTTEGGQTRQERAGLGGQVLRDAMAVRGAKVFCACATAASSIRAPSGSRSHLFLAGTLLGKPHPGERDDNRLRPGSCRPSRFDRRTAGSQFTVP